MCFSVGNALSDNSMRHHGGQNMLWACFASRVHNILTTAMMHIIVAKSKDHTKPQLYLFFFFHNIKVKENVFSEHELKMALRDTVARAALSGLLSAMAISQTDKGISSNYGKNMTSFSTS